MVVTSPSRPRSETCIVGSMPILWQHLMCLASSVVRCKVIKKFSTQSRGSVSKLGCCTGQQYRGL
eukprot:749795-Amphidinium_carterae.1